MGRRDRRLNLESGPKDHGIYYRINYFSEVMQASSSNRRLVEIGDRRGSVHLGGGFGYRMVV